MTYAPVKIEFADTFRRKNLTQPGPWLGDYEGAFWWYFTVYADYDGAGYRNHVFRWKPGAKAEHVDLISETVARGDIGVHAVGGGGAASFSWDNASVDYPNLWTQEVLGFVPASTDPQVALLAERIAALEQRVAALEAADAGADGLTDADRFWVKAVRAVP